MTALQKPLPMTVEEYLAAEPLSDVRHEFLGGDVYAMAGATARHNIISGNIFATLRGLLRGGPCTTFIHDMKVRLRTQDDLYFYYPDVMVACDPADDEPLFRERPSIIVEVMSESTERLDRREKYFAYRTIPALTQYILVEQQKLEVTSYLPHRGKPALILTSPEDRLGFPAIQAEIVLADIYESSGIPR